MALILTVQNITYVLLVHIPHDSFHDRMSLEVSINRRHCHFVQMAFI